MRTALLALTLSVGCTAKPDTGWQEGPCLWYQDLDGDGHGDADSIREGSCEQRPEGWSSSGSDCDDTDPAIHPGALELCDGLDNDCDGFVDDQDPDVDLADAPDWFPDEDADGYGDSARPLRACSQPEGLLADGSDCDDRDPLVNPGAPEHCDGVDEDCDGELDEDAVDAPTWYADGDGDGYGAPHATTTACLRPSGHTDDHSDCDDSRDDSYPGAPEYCDGVDNDCDGDVDEDDALDAPTWYIDGDVDGYGDASSAVIACARQKGTVSNDQDCDDSRDDVFPAAPEYCDGVDNDCDLFVDEDDALDAPTWHPDDDGDGFGDPGRSTPACHRPSGWVEPSAATDCDDGDGAINPLATEICDGLDNDCDGLVDDADDSLDASTGSAWYTDADSDGYGDPASAAMACVVPSGHVGDNTDCDDSAPAIHPAATETCDGIDNDCDSLVDDADDSLDSSTGSTFYADTDGDGYGDPANAIMACDTPGGYTELSKATDCDDTSFAVNPAAVEICDSIDNDCDGLVDDADGSLDASTRSTWYLDADGDGFGGGSTSSACAMPSGYAATGADCDDGDAAINPSAAEICDGIDNDCDSLVDDADGSVTGGSFWYADDDLDGYGDPGDWLQRCDEPAGYTDDASDCDDSDDDVNPAASESCDGEDDDCDGAVDDSAGCPCATASYGGHGYMFCTSTATWDTADRRYQGYGYLLATINDASEQAWLTTTAASYSSGRSWWIGANDKSSEGSWRWDSGQSWSYSNWSSGQPDNGSHSEDCGNMAGYGSGAWNDEQCWTSLSSIYEAH
jgi:hypothetical protein